MEEAIIQAVQFVLGLVHIKPEVAAMIFGVLFLISEVLGGFSAIKSNSIYQLISRVIRKLAGKDVPK